MYSGSFRGNITPVAAQRIFFKSINKPERHKKLHNILLLWFWCTIWPYTLRIYIQFLFVSQSFQFEQRNNAIVFTVPLICSPTEQIWKNMTDYGENNNEK